MSDLVRGTVPDKARPAAEPTPRPADRRSAVPAPERDGPPAPGVAPPASPAGEAATPRLPAPADGGDERAEALFGELERFLTGVRRLTRSSEPFPWPELEGLMEQVVASLERASDLFWVANNPPAPPGVDSLAFHQARVAVLAARIGAAAGYDDRRAVTLGMAGALIDVGLWLLPEGLLRRLDAPSADDETLYRAHPSQGADLVRRWSPPSEDLVQAVLQHHEREQGQGFPQGLAGAAIHPDARILGLVDTYASLTVPASARPRLRPHEAIREIVRSRNESFAAPLIKALLTEISVFPPGTLVRLNTGEVGRVVAVNRNHPLRPRLEVVTDTKGQPLPTPRPMDLSETPFLYITGPVGQAPR